MIIYASVVSLFEQTVTHKVMSITVPEWT